MRLLKLVLLATLAIPMGAIAQTRGHRPPPAQPIPPESRPQMGVPLPQIGLPLPRLGLPPLNNQSRRVDWFNDRLSAFSNETGRVDWFQDRDFSGTIFSRARHYGARFGTSVIGTPFVGAPFFIYVPQYVIPVAPPAFAPASEHIETELTTGSLILQVEPATAQVFVDGYYFGTPEEFDGRRGELALEPGPHKVQLVAPGYESVTVDVRITANQTVRYQNAMKPLAPAPPPPPAAPIQPKTIYLIPGCYLGDVPPKDARLPATCDVTRTVTFVR